MFSIVTVEWASYLSSSNFSLVLISVLLVTLVTLAYGLTLSVGDSLLRLFDCLHAVMFLTRRSSAESRDIYS